MTSSTVPFLDLKPHHAELEDRLMSAFSDALHTGGFVGGKAVSRFENDFARYCGAEHAVGVGSGTDALRFALLAVGVTEGDGVVTVPNTFIATTEAITQAGAQPFFVDVDEQTMNINPENLRAFLADGCRRDSAGVLRHEQSGLRISAIVPVHLYGQPADMDEIADIAGEYECRVVEDACQAHGAWYHSTHSKSACRAGAMGDAAGFSFYPGKNLGACGEAGAVTTGSAETAAKVANLRDHGQDQKYVHSAEGYNGRLDAIQASFLAEKLPFLDDRNAARRRLAQRYSSALRKIPGVAVPMENPKAKSVYHLYVIRIDDRDGLREFLNERNIQSGLHYPIPLHLQAAYERLGLGRGTYPVTERAAERILSLPMFPEMTDEQQDRVIDAVREFQVSHSERTEYDYSTTDAVG